MHMDYISRSSTLMKVVDILGDKQEVAIRMFTPMLLQGGQGPVS